MLYWQVVAMKNSEIIKEIRSRLRLSQTELAVKLGVSFATVNRWEKGRCEPSPIALAEEICRRYRLSERDHVLDGLRLPLLALLYRRKQGGDISNRSRRNHGDRLSRTAHFRCNNGDRPADSLTSYALTAIAKERPAKWVFRKNN